MRRRDFLVALPVGATTLAIGPTAALAGLGFETQRSGSTPDSETHRPGATAEPGSLGSPDTHMQSGAVPRAAGVDPEPDLGHHAGTDLGDPDAQPSDGFIEDPMLGPPPTWLLAPLQPGDEIGLRWRLDSVAPVGYGAAVISLSNGFREARVHVCARQGRARGIASTRHFDLLLMNDGDGRSTTDEPLGRVIKTLGAYVARAERARPDLVAGLEGMLPHGSRVERFGDAREVLA